MPTRSSSTIPVRTVYTSLHQRWTSFPAFSNIWRSARAKDVNVNIRTSQFRRLRTIVSGISYLRLCVYHRHLDSFKASWRQYFFAQPTRHDSARSWLLRLLELRLTNFPTYLLTNRWICFYQCNRLSTFVLYHADTSMLPPVNYYFRQRGGSYVIVLSFRPSFCQQDNWQTRKRTSTKLGRRGQRMTL